MPYVITTATEKISELLNTPGGRIFGIPGGTSAGKTIGVEQVLIDMAQRDTSPTITSIVSESMPHIKRGAERDFLNIMKEHNYYSDARWNMSDHTYEFESGSKIEFFSVDQAEKVRGPRRDRLFINEANNTSFETFEQLELRTKEFIIMDWNPTNEFYYYTDVKEHLPGVHELVLTYLDNEGLDPRIVASVESRRHRKEWWKVYGEGKLGEVEGKIYKGWNIIDEVPHEARLVRYAIDFGWFPDPAVLIAIYEYNGGYIIDEILYGTNIPNKDLAAAILNAEEKALTVADSAEPKSIADIKSLGVNIIGCEKGADSVRNGIEVVQGQKISMTKQSVNVIRDYRNYLWMVDKNGKVIAGEPEHEFSHGMDPVRYGIVSLIRPKINSVHIHRPTHNVRRPHTAPRVI